MKPLFGALALLLGVCFAANAQLAVNPGGVLNAAQPRYVDLPLYFIENQGQLDGRAAYYIPGRQTSVYFTRTGAPFS